MGNEFWKSSKKTMEDRTSNPFLPEVLPEGNFLTDTVGPPWLATQGIAKGLVDYAGALGEWTGNEGLAKWSYDTSNNLLEGMTTGIETHGQHVDIGWDSPFRKSYRLLTGSAPSIALGYGGGTLIKAALGPALTKGFVAAGVKGITAAERMAAHSASLLATFPLAASEAGSFYKEGREAGKTPEELFWNTNVNLVSNALLEHAPIVDWFEPATLSGRIFRTGIQESIEEGLQGVTSNYLKMHGWKGFDNFSNDLMEGVAEGMLAGFLSGGAIGSTGEFFGNKSKIDWNDPNMKNTLELVKSKAKDHGLNLTDKQAQSTVQDIINKANKEDIRSSVALDIEAKAKEAMAMKVVRETQTHPEMAVYEIKDGQTFHTLERDKGFEFVVNNPKRIKDVVKVNKERVHALQHIWDTFRGEYGFAKDMGWMQLDPAFRTYLFQNITLDKDNTSVAYEQLSTLFNENILFTSGGDAASARNRFFVPKAMALSKGANPYLSAEQLVANGIDLNNFKIVATSEQALKADEAYATLRNLLAEKIDLSLMPLSKKTVDKKAVELASKGMPSVDEVSTAIAQKLKELQKVHKKSWRNLLKKESVDNTGKVLENRKTFYNWLLEYSRNLQVDFGSIFINSIQEVAELAALVRNPVAEVAQVLFFKDGRLVNQIADSLGNPILSEINKITVAKYLAANPDVIFYATHNHPSGNHNASETTDMAAQESLKAFPQFQGQIITDGKNFTFIGLDGVPVSMEYAKNAPKKINFTKNYVSLDEVVKQSKSLKDSEVLIAYLDIVPENPSSKNVITIEKYETSFLADKSDIGLHVLNRLDTYRVPYYSIVSNKNIDQSKLPGGLYSLHIAGKDIPGATIERQTSIFEKKTKGIPLAESKDREIQEHYFTRTKKIVDEYIIKNPNSRAAIAFSYEAKSGDMDRAYARALSPDEGNIFDTLPKELQDQWALKKAFDQETGETLTLAEHDTIRGTHIFNARADLDNKIEEGGIPLAEEPTEKLSKQWYKPTEVKTKTEEQRKAEIKFKLIRAVESERAALADMYRAKGDLVSAKMAEQGQFDRINIQDIEDDRISYPTYKKKQNKLQWEKIYAALGGERTQIPGRYQRVFTPTKSPLVTLFVKEQANRQILEHLGLREQEISKLGMMGEKKAIIEQAEKTISENIFKTVQQEKQELLSRERLEEQANQIIEKEQLLVDLGEINQGQIDNILETASLITSDENYQDIKNIILNLINTKVDYSLPASEQARQEATAVNHLRNIIQSYADMNREVGEGLRTQYAIDGTELRNTMAFIERETGDPRRDVFRTNVQKLVNKQKYLLSQLKNFLRFKAKTVEEKKGGQNSIESIERYLAKTEQETKRFIESSKLKDVIDAEVMVWAKEKATNILVPKDIKMWNELSLVGQGANVQKTLPMGEYNIEHIGVDSKGQHNVKLVGTGLVEGEAFYTTLETLVRKGISKVAFNEYFAKEAMERAIESEYNTNIMGDKQNIEDLITQQEDQGENISLGSPKTKIQKTGEVIEDYTAIAKVVLSMTKLFGMDPDATVTFFSKYDSRVKDFFKKHPILSAEDQDLFLKDITKELNYAMFAEHWGITAQNIIATSLIDYAKDAYPQMSEVDRVAWAKEMNTLLSYAAEEIRVGDQKIKGRLTYTASNRGLFRLWDNQKQRDLNVEKLKQLYKLVHQEEAPGKLVNLWNKAHQDRAFFKMLPKEIQALLIYTKGTMENAILQENIKSGRYDRTDWYSKQLDGYTHYGFDPVQGQKQAGRKLVQEREVVQKDAPSYAEFADSVLKSKDQKLLPYDEALRKYVTQEMITAYQHRTIENLKRIGNVNNKNLPYIAHEVDQTITDLAKKAGYVNSQGVANPSAWLENNGYRQLKDAPAFSLKYKGATYYPWFHETIIPMFRSYYQETPMPGWLRPFIMVNMFAKRLIMASPLQTAPNIAASQALLTKQGFSTWTQGLNPFHIASEAAKSGIAAKHDSLSHLKNMGYDNAKLEMMIRNGAQVFMSERFFTSLFNQQLVKEHPEFRGTIDNIRATIRGKFGMDNYVFNQYIAKMNYLTIDMIHQAIMKKNPKLNTEQAMQYAADVVADMSGTINRLKYSGGERDLLQALMFARDFTYGYIRMMTGSGITALRSLPGASKLRMGFKTNNLGWLNAIFHGEKTQDQWNAVSEWYIQALGRSILAKLLFLSLGQLALWYARPPEERDEDDKWLWNNESLSQMKLPWKHENGDSLYIDFPMWREFDQLVKSVSSPGQFADSKRAWMFSQVLNQLSNTTATGMPVTVNRKEIPGYLRWKDRVSFAFDQIKPAFLRQGYRGVPQLPSVFGVNLKRGSMRDMEKDAEFRRLSAAREYFNLQTRKKTTTATIDEVLAMHESGDISSAELKRFFKGLKRKKKIMPSLRKAGKKIFWK